MNVRHWLCVVSYVWWSLRLGEQYVSVCQLVLLTLFRAKWKPAGESKWLRITKQTTFSTMLQASCRKNTNEAIWPKRQVNEECWLKKRAACRIKGLSCSLWAMLCADSCFKKTLRGGSGYKVASDKKPHDKKARGFAQGSHAHVSIHTQMYQTHQTFIHNEDHTRRGASSMSQISD